jgi:hypothetical protein
VNVVSATHPLHGERLSALSFCRRNDELLLVVVLPDGTPGMIASDATDVFGGGARPADAMALSVEGVRHFRSLVDAHEVAGRKRTRKPPAKPRPWKVVRHAVGVDPFQSREWVYSSHPSEVSARRARDKVRSVMVRASGYETAAAWAWSVVHDPAGLLQNPPTHRVD